MLQAIAPTSLMFGFLHFKDGIPQGWLGLILAGIYGLALAWWTWKRGSIWQAVALHFTTDIVNSSPRTSDRLQAGTHC